MPKVKDKDDNSRIIILPKVKDKVDNSRIQIDHPKIIQEEHLSQIDVHNKIEIIKREEDCIDNSRIQDKIQNSRIQIENPRNIQVATPPKIKSKTKVKLLINGDSNNVNWINISKPPNDVNLNDIKLILKNNPKRYGMSNEIMYDYCVKITDEDGDIGFEDIDDDNTILPLFGDKIVLKCWTSIKL